MVNCSRCGKKIRLFQKKHSIDDNTILCIHCYDKHVEEQRRRVWLRKQRERIDKEKKKYLDLGTNLFNKKEYKKALSNFDKYIEYNESNPYVWNYIGLIKFNLKRYDEAVYSFHKALKLKPNDSTYYNLAKAYLEHGNLERAIKNFDEAINLSDNNSKYYFEKGKALEKKGQYDKALESIDDAIILDSNNYTYLKTKAILLYKLKNYSKAENFFGKCLSSHSADDEIWFYKAMSLIKKDEFEKALDSLDQAVKLNNKNFRYFFEKGRCHQKLQQYEKALDSYKLALRIDDKQGNVWYLAGKVDIKLGNYKHAIACLKRANTLNPESLRGWIALADTYRIIERYPDAFSCYHKILELDQKNTVAKKKIENLVRKLKIDIDEYEKSEDYSKAVKLLTILINEKPKNKEFKNLKRSLERKIRENDENYWYTEALKQKEKKNYKKALKQLEKAINLKSNFKKAKNEKIKIETLQIKQEKIDGLISEADEYFNSKNFLDAYATYSKILEEDKNHAAALKKQEDTYTKILKNIRYYKTTKKYGDSLSLINNILDINPHDETIKNLKKEIDELLEKERKNDETYWFNEAVKLKKKKQYESALYFLDKALKINEFFSEAINEKNEIKSILTFEKEISHLINKANTEFQNEDYQKALETCNVILNEDKKNSYAKSKKQKILIRLTKQMKYFEKQKKYARSLNLLELILKEKPGRKELQNFKEKLLASIRANEEQNRKTEVFKKSDNPVVQLGNEKKRKNISKLITYTKSENYNDRRLAASALGKLHSLTPEIFSSVPTLVELTNDKKPQVRQYAIKALGKIGDKQAVHQLEKIKRNDEKEYNRESAEIAIEKINRSLSLNQLNKNNSITRGESMENLCNSCKLRDECKDRSSQKIVGCSNYVEISYSETEEEQCPQKEHDEEYWYQKAIEAEKEKRYLDALTFLDNALKINEFFSEAIHKKNMITSHFESDKKIESKKKTNEEQGNDVNWTEEIKRIVLYELSSDQFNLKDMYDYETKLKEKFPQNDHVKEKIRQQLQVLRDRGVIVFLGGGNYSVASRYSKHRRLLEKELKKETKSGQGIEDQSDINKKLDLKKNLEYSNDLNELLKFPGIGRGAIVSLKIAGYDNLDKVAALDLNEISKIDGIGSEKAKIILKALNQRKDRSEIEGKKEFSSKPKIGKTYNNEEIQHFFKCSSQGGMRRSHRTNSLVLISKQTESVYTDFPKDDLFHYTGMGKSGNQKLSFGQNKTLYESNVNNVDIHLFVVFEEKKYVYFGKVRLAKSPYTQDQKGENNKKRSVWVFPLRLKDDFAFDLLKKDFQRYKPESIKRMSAAVKGETPLNTIEIEKNECDRNRFKKDKNDEVNDTFCKLEKTKQEKIFERCLNCAHLIDMDGRKICSRFNHDVSRVFIKDCKEFTTLKNLTSCHEDTKDNNNIVQLLESDIVQRKDKHCIIVNGYQTINCKYFKVLHPKKNIQDLIDRASKGIVKSDFYQKPRWKNEINDLFKEINKKKYNDEK